MSSVRAFARYWSTIDTSTEIPPDGLLPFRPGRAKPYLYTDEEIRQLLDAAKSMPTQFSLHRSTYHCLLGLLAVSGMRISEALNLELRDVDWMEALLTIRSTKFGKSRLVPLHPTAKVVLSDYVLLRNELFSDPSHLGILPFKDRGTLIAQRRVSPHTIASYRDTFRLLLKFVHKTLSKNPSEIAAGRNIPRLINSNIWPSVCVGKRTSPQ
jgi:integrase